MIVEDEAILCMVLKMKLIEWGYEISSIASSGEDAVNQALLNIPDLIIMDIKIKGDIDGIEAAKMIHAEQQIPVIFYSAHGDPQTLSRIKKIRHSGVLDKSANYVQLKEHLEELFRA